MKINEVTPSNQDDSSYSFNGTVFLRGLLELNSMRYTSLVCFDFLFFSNNRKMKMTTTKTANIINTTVLITAGDIKGLLLFAIGNSSVMVATWTKLVSKEEVLAGVGVAVTTE